MDELISGILELLEECTFEEKKLIIENIMITNKANEEVYNGAQNGANLY